MKRILKTSMVIVWLGIAGWAVGAKADSRNPLPPTALEACSDKQSGDLCSFVNETGDLIRGACSYQGNVDGKLYCVPIN